MGERGNSDAISSEASTLKLGKRQIFPVFERYFQEVELFISFDPEIVFGSEDCFSFFSHRFSPP